RWRDGTGAGAGRGGAVGFDRGPGGTPGPERGEPSNHLHAKGKATRRYGRTPRPSAGGKDTPGRRPAGRRVAVTELVRVRPNSHEFGYWSLLAERSRVRLPVHPRRPLA